MHFITHIFFITLIFFTAVSCKKEPSLGKDFKIEDVINEEDNGYSLYINDYYPSGNLEYEKKYFLKIFPEKEIKEITDYHGLKCLSHNFSARFLKMIAKKQDPEKISRFNKSLYSRNNNAKNRQRFLRQMDIFIEMTAKVTKSF